MDTNRKNQKSDLRKNYRVYFEIGLVAVLAFCILAMKVEWRAGEPEIDFSEEQIVVHVKNVKRTQQKEQKPLPPSPEILIEVPNDKVITGDEIKFIQWDDVPKKLDIPPIDSGSKSTSENFFTVVQQMPELTNKKEFYSSYKYPRDCRLAGIEGTVYVSFIVNETGKISNAKVIKGIGGGCDEYALNYIIKNAEFSPGRQRGKAVSVKFTLPITFNLR